MYLSCVAAVRLVLILPVALYRHIRSIYQLPLPGRLCADDEHFEWRTFHNARSSRVHDCAPSQNFAERIRQGVEVFTPKSYLHAHGLSTG